MDMCFDIGLRLSNSSISGIWCSKFASLDADVDYKGGYAA
jgi:hypothetical protein